MSHSPSKTGSKGWRRSSSWQVGGKQPVYEGPVLPQMGRVWLRAAPSHGLPAGCWQQNQGGCGGKGGCLVASHTMGALLYTSHLFQITEC